MRTLALLSAAMAIFLYACGTIAPEDMTPANTSYTGYNATTVQMVPPATEQGRACANTCLNGLSQCQQVCENNVAGCESLNIARRATGGTQQACTTAKCDAQCTTSYRICHTNCGGQVIEKPARSKQ